MAKKRKPSVPASVAKKKGGVRSGFGDFVNNKGSKQGNNKGAKQADNPFEKQWTRTKFDVLGKKKKSEGKRVGVARSAALDKRKNSLLLEYQQRGKTNVFLDHRFGEQDDSLGDEDKAILRFQKERMAQMQRKSKFALDDEDDDQAMEVLTHGGTALSTLDDFQDDISADEDDDAGLGADIVRDLHFGGGAGKLDGGEADAEADGKRRTKKEVMEEVIAKSKYFKAQKAKEKEEDHELKEKLDADFTALAQSNGLLSLVRPKKVDALKSLLAKGPVLEGSSITKVLQGGDKTLEEKEKPDEYDKLVKEMGFEIRGRATDRSKTAEELAKEELTRLEELEKKRKQRMLGVESDEDEGANDEEETERQKKKKRRDFSGDDLGENFVMEDEYQEKGWVDEVLARKGDEDKGEDEDESSGDEEDGDDDEDEGSGDEDGSGDGGEDSDEDSDEESAESGDEDWENSEDEVAGIDGIPKLSAKDQVLLNKLLAAKGGPKPQEHMRELLEKEQKKTPKVLKQPAGVQELDTLPYVIDAPQTLPEFRKLVDGRPIQDLETAVQRIRKCNAISLAAENRRKMQVFYNVLLQYFANLAGERPLCMQRINSLVKPLIELSGEIHYFAAMCARERIVRMQRQLSEKLKSGDDISCWPSSRTLLLFRLWSMVFPPSDFRHAVMTPAMLLMAEYLLRCPVKSGHDVAVGAFICSSLLSVLRPARRFCPEALSFLQALLLSALPKANRSNGVAQLAIQCPAHLVEFVASNPWLQLSNSKMKTQDVQPLDFMNLVTEDASSPTFESDSFKAGMLYNVLQTVRGFAGIYKDLMSFPEIFNPFISLLQMLKRDVSLPEILLALTKEVTESLEEKVKEHERLRQPLRMRMSKPVPIKMYNPVFEDNFVKGRDYDPDRERAEMKKLKKQLKREAKGAARELRKDNYFIADVKAGEKAVAQQERDEKYRKAMSFLEQQESAFKSGQLGKGKKRKKR